MAGSTSGITNQASGMMGSFVGGGGSGKIPTGMRDMINGIDNGGSLQNSLSQGGSAISDLPQNRAVPMNGMMMDLNPESPTNGQMIPRGPMPQTPNDPSRFRDLGNGLSEMIGGKPAVMRDSYAPATGIQRSNVMSEQQRIMESFANGGQQAPNLSQGAETTRGPQPQQPQYDVNTAAAQGLQRAQQGAASEMNYRPMAVQGGGYRPAQASPTGYTAAGAKSQGYEAAQAGSQGYDASGLLSQGYTAAQSGAAPTLSANQVAGGQIAGTDLQAYMNPYESQVVQQSLSDIERSRLMQQNIGGAQAGAANAFGGSRQGVAEAETNRAFADQAARTASGLRQAGYQNAQQMAGQDIATGMQASLANQGANLQAGTTSAQLAQQRALQNQSALNQAGQFGAGAANQAAAQASQQQQAASQFGAGAANQAALQNQAALNQAGQFGASASNQAALQNQAALNQARQYGAGATNQASLANQGALNQASQFGASQNMQAQLANQQAGLSGSQQRLQAGSQLGNLSNLGFGMGQQIQGRMDQQGAQQQALQQQLINAAKQQYAGYTGSPAQSLQYLLQAVGQAPAVGSNTQQKNPGLFDYLSLGLGSL